MPSSRLALPGSALVLVTAMVSAGRAHVAPSENQNNRYIALAPLGDRVRLAYIVFMGEKPGALARQRMDSNGDGRLSKQEADRYAQSVATEVAARLDFTVDGRSVPIEWSSIDIGLGPPTVHGGAFAIDLVAWACLETGQVEHQLSLFDRFELPLPGESELSISDSPGITIDESRLGADPSPTRKRDFRWTGGPGLAKTDGYHMTFTVDPDLATFPSGSCPPPSALTETKTAAGSRWRLLWWAGGITLALGAFGALALLVRRRTGS